MQKINTPARVRQIIFSLFVPFLNLGGITKDLMTGPMGNCLFCLPEILDVPRSKAKEGLKETKLIVSLGTSH